MPRLVVTSALPVEIATWLGAGVEVIAPREGALGRADLERLLPEADALICLLTDRIDDALLARAPRLRVVANYAVGYDNVDVAAATRRGIAVANTPGVLTEATADLAFALLLACARRLSEGEALVRTGGWTGWEPGQLLGADVAGATLAILGLGRIGRAVARRAQAFGMRVLAVSRHAAPAADDAVLRCDLDEALAAADFVSIHWRLDDETRGRIGRRELALLRPTAILVNTARGPIVDEEALAEALAAGRLGGAGLDVYADEPRIAPALLAAPRTVLLPHLGSATRRTRAAMAELCARAVAAVLRGERPDNLINPEVLA